MAILSQTFSKDCPKIDLGDPADSKRYMELITQRTTLSAGVVKNVQESEVETLIGLLREGRSVHTGIAIFRPTIDAQGNLSVSVRVDKRITDALNYPGTFSGRINNSSSSARSVSVAPCERSTTGMTLPTKPIWAACARYSDPRTTVSARGARPAPGSGTGAEQPVAQR